MKHRKRCFRCDQRNSKRFVIFFFFDKFRILSERTSSRWPNSTNDVFPNPVTNKLVFPKHETWRLIDSFHQEWIKEDLGKIHSKLKISRNLPTVELIGYLNYPWRRIYLARCSMWILNSEMIEWFDGNCHNWVALVAVRLSSRLYVCNCWPFWFNTGISTYSWTKILDAKHNRELRCDKKSGYESC